MDVQQALKHVDKDVCHGAFGQDVETKKILVLHHAAELSVEEYDALVASLIGYVNTPEKIRAYFRRPNKLVSSLGDCFVF